MQRQVTACLTVHNAQAFIADTLDSLDRQTWRELKILISDDCSTDRSPSLLERFAAAAPEKRFYFRQDPRLGWVDNTNFLLDRVDTEFFFLCYHDDTLEPSYVEALVTAIPEDAAIVGAFSDLELTSVKGERSVRSHHANDHVLDPVERALNIIRMNGFPWVANRGVFRSTVLGTVGGLRKNLAGEFSAAFPWVLGMSLEGGLKRVPEVLCRKKLHPTGVSSGWKKTYRERLALHLDMFATVWRSSLEPAQKDILMLELSGICRRIMEEGTKSRKDTNPGKVRPPV